MSSLYPSVPDLPHGAWWPRSMEDMSLGDCPVCGASWVTYIDLGPGGPGPHGMYVKPGLGHVADHLPDLNYPHLRYECGGVWREVDGMWVGKCWAGKHQQELELTFAEEAV